MKKIILLSALIMLSNSVFSGPCGTGKVTSVMEGGWNTDDFMIRIDYSGENSTHSGTEFNGLIVYRSSLNPKRLNGIKSIALSALISGRRVRTYSHTNNCSEASEIEISS
jgi:hypothetical protein